MTSGMDIVNLAKKSLGVNYVWGGNDLASGVDCSGLVQQVFKNFGISVPRVTYQQIDAGAPVGMKDLRPGDLVFFATESASEPDHVGIYMGGGKMIHAPHTGDVVKITDMTSSYYTNRFLGGRRISGVTGGVDGADSSPDTVEAVARAARMDGQELAETYGLSMAFFQSEPELMGLLTQAVDGQWSPERWTAALKNTDYWKNNSETQRQLRLMETSDPATFKANMSATTEQMRLAATKLGAVISDGQLTEAARMAMASGWDQAKIENYLGQYIDFTDQHVLGGQAGAHYRAIAQLAYRNGVTMDDQAMKNQAAYIARGITTYEDALNQVRQTAAGSFPGFAQQILAGQNMDDIAQPYVQMMSRELGQPYTALNVFTPEIRNALNRRDQQGGVAPMSLTDFQSTLRGSTAWRNSTSGINQTLDIGNQVLRSLGLR